MVILNFIPLFIWMFFFPVVNLCFFKDHTSPTFEDVRVLSYIWILGIIFFASFAIVLSI